MYYIVYITNFVLLSCLPNAIKNNSWRFISCVRLLFVLCVSPSQSYVRIYVPTGKRISKTITPAYLSQYPAKKSRPLLGVHGLVKFLVLIGNDGQGAPGCRITVSLIYKSCFHRLRLPDVIQVMRNTTQLLFLLW